MAPILFDLARVYILAMWYRKRIQLKTILSYFRKYLNVLAFLNLGRRFPALRPYDVYSDTNNQSRSSAAICDHNYFAFMFLRYLFLSLNLTSAVLCLSPYDGHNTGRADKIGELLLDA